VKIIAATIIIVGFFLWLRLRYHQLMVPVRQAEDAREAKIREVLDNRSNYVDQPVDLLFGAIGQERSSSSGDFGLVIYNWRANNLCIHAYVRNNVCSSIGEHQCSIYD